MKKGLAIWLIAMISAAIAFFGVRGSYVADDMSKKASNIRQQTDSLSQHKETESTKQSVLSQAPQTPKKEEVHATRISSITSSMKGEQVTICGVPSGIKTPKQTTFFMMKDDSGKIQCVLFNKTANDNKGRKELLDSCAASGKQVYVDGEIDIYNGTLEVKAWKVYTK